MGGPITLASLPEDVVIGAFRYALGKTTATVPAVREWLTDHWHLLPHKAREVIHRDLGRAIQKDADARRLAETSSGVSLMGLPLGQDLDRAEWFKLADRIGLAHG